MVLLLTSLNGEVPQSSVDQKFLGMKVLRFLGAKVLCVERLLLAAKVHRSEKY